MVSLGVCCICNDEESHAGTPSNPSPMQNEKPSWMVAGLGLIPCETGVVHRPCAAIDSVLIAIVLLFMLTQASR